MNFSETNKRLNSRNLKFQKIDLNKEFIEINKRLTFRNLNFIEIDPK